MSEINLNIKTKKTYDKIRIAGVVEDSIVDGPGMRIVIFTQGCPHNCEDCHNTGTHDFNGGFEADIELLAEKIVNYKTNKVTISGGEPFCRAGELVSLIKKVKAKKNIDLFVYTGYELSELFEIAENDKTVKNLLAETNFLKDGKYIAEKKSLECFYRGSENQNIYDITCYPNSKKVRMIKNKEEME